jgi:TRAP transporter TAXI family solute receptor
MILSRPLKLLPFEPEMVQFFREKYAFSSQKLTKDMYDGKVIYEEFSTPAANLTLIVNKDVGEDVVYKMTKAICENAEKVHKIGPTFVNFAAAVAWDNLGVPLHPGAEKYYREKGYMK